MCERCVEDFCATRSIVSGVEMVCATRREKAMRSNMSRLVIGGCRVGDCRGGIYRVEANVLGDMVSGTVVWRSNVSRLSYRDGWRGGCEVRGDVMKMMGGGFGGVNGRFCGPKGQRSVMTG